MDKQIAIRRVRIAVSVCFGLLTLALCVLWVRSYYRCDVISRCEVSSNVGTVSTASPPTSRPTKRIAVQQHDVRMVTLGSNNGYCYWIRLVHPARGSGGPELSAHGWKLGGAEASNNPARFQWTSSANRALLKVPYWFLTAITISFAASCLIQKRFSLRALLISTTLIAFVLGLAVWMANL
jgi:hypothetical protein